MNEIFKVGEHDYTMYVVEGGITCTPVEILARKVITMDGVTHKARTGVKDQVRVSMEFVPDSVYRQLVADTASLYFAAVYPCGGGIATKTCCTDTGVIATLKNELDDGVYWDTIELDFYER